MLHINKKTGEPRYALALPANTNGNEGKDTNIILPILPFTRYHHRYDIWCKMHDVHLEKMTNTILDSIYGFQENNHVATANECLLREAFKRYVYKTSSNKYKNYHFLK